MKALISWWAKNHIAANFLMYAIIFGGLFAWFNLKKEIFPETSTNVVSITIPYPNASPEAVEKGVCIPVEEAVEDVDGVERIQSVAAENAGVVYVEVRQGEDVDKVVNNLRSRVDGITNLAEDAEEAIIEEIPIRTQILSITVTAPTSERELQEIAEQLRDNLIALEGITSVVLAGSRRHEISIEVSEQTLRERGLTFDQVAMAVKQSSVDLPAGSVRTAAGEIIIRTQARKYAAEEFAGITILTRPDGSRVLLGEIAKIVDGFEEVDLFRRFDGKDAIVLNVYRTGNEDTLAVAKAAKDYLKTAQNQFVSGVDFKIWNDISLLLEGRLQLMANDAIMGFILVCILLALFLRPGLAFHVALGIPIAFFGGLIFLPWADVSVNMISIFAFILVLGIVCDDAIVVGENVYERMRKGEPSKIAAPRGTHEVMIVAIFGVLTVMCSFLPMLGVSGVSGKIWRNIPLVVIPVLIISLVETNLILPSHLATLKPEKPDDQVGPFTRLQRKITAGVDWFIAHPYKRFMGFAIRNRYATVAVFVTIALTVIGLVFSGFIKSEYFPKVEGEVISAKLTLANGVPVEATKDAIKKLEEAAVKLNKIYKRPDGRPIVKHMLATVGAQPFKVSFQPALGNASSNLGEVTIELMGASERTQKAVDITNKWRELAGPIPGAVELTFIANTSNAGNAIDLELHGPDLQELRKAADHLKDHLSKQKGLTDLSDNLREGKKELKLGITPEGEALNLRLSDISRQVRQAFNGEEVQRLQRGRDEVKVIVRYPRDERLSQDNLDNMNIRVPSGAHVPFSTVATATATHSYATIYRADRQRGITITADVDAKAGGNANEIVAELNRSVFPEMKKLFPRVNYGFQGEQKEQRQSMEDLRFGGLLCLVGIYILLAVPLRSYVQPLIVMGVIPFGMVGSIIGHMIMGYELSIMSMIGMIALMGVVVNESLVLVEFVNRHRRAGQSVVEAAREGGAARFQAIMLTSIVSFIGVMPIIFETSIQAKFLVPCALSLAFGCMANMFNTLILVPCGYAIVEDIRNLIFTKEHIAKRELREQEEAAERGLDWSHAPESNQSAP